MPLRLLALVAVAAIDPAPQSPAPPSMTFDEALGLTATTPRVVGNARALNEKAATDREISALPYNPQVTVMPGWRFAPRDARQPELVAEIIQPWNLSGQPSARRRTVSLEEKVLEAEARATALAARLAAARAWIDVWAAEHVLEETRREEHIAGELERLVDRASTLGAMTRADVAEARAYHAEARVAVLNAEGERYQRGLILGREIGSPEAAPIHAAGSLPDAPVPPPSKRSEYLQQMAALPGVVIKTFQAQAAAARDLEEKAARGTIAQLGATLQRDAPDGLVVSALARVTFPVFDRGERERAGMRADAARLQGERDDVLVAARSELAASFHEVDHTAELLAVYRDDLAPASREAAQTRRRIFENGGATLLEVLQSERTAIAAASRLRRIEAEQAWARAKLWLLVTQVAMAGPDREAHR
jgi:cobalt-zinc-cadmium efflux system outer membrane protein